MAAAVKKNVCLVVIDGWGISEETRGEPAPFLAATVHATAALIHSLYGGPAGNAIKNAETPVMDGLAAAEGRGEYTTLDASGLAVGIPAGVMGNSEVGHFTIGTGRVVYQVSWRGTLATSVGQCVIKVCDSCCRTWWASICPSLTRLWHQNQLWWMLSPPPSQRLVESTSWD